MPSEDMSETIGHFVGLVLGDGYICETKSRNYFISVGSTKPEILNLFEFLARKLHLRVFKYRRLHTRTFPNKTTRTDWVETRFVSSKTFYKPIRDRKPAPYEWNIGDPCVGWVHPKTASFQKGVLRGLFDAEAHVSTKMIEISSKCKSGLLEVEEILGRMGIRAHFGRIRPDLCRLRILDIPSLKRYQELIGFGLIRKKRALDTLVEKRKWFSKTKTDPSLLTKIAKLRDHGVNNYKIATQVGLAPGTIRYWLRKLEERGKNDVSAKFTGSGNPNWGGD